MPTTRGPPPPHLRTLTRTRAPPSRPLRPCLLCPLLFFLGPGQPAGGASAVRTSSGLLSTAPPPQGPCGTEPRQRRVRATATLHRGLHFRRRPCAANRRPGARHGGASAARPTRSCVRPFGGSRSHPPRGRRPRASARPGPGEV